MAGKCEACTTGAKRKWCADANQQLAGDVMVIEIGIVCYKTAGRSAGEKVVITSIDREKGIAMVQGIVGKEKKCNLRHLWITKEKIDVKEFMTKVRSPKAHTKEKKQKSVLEQEKQAKKQRKEGKPQAKQEKQYSVAGKKPKKENVKEKNKAKGKKSK